MAARATWSGSISFGMVSIPVKIYTATDSDKSLSFNQLNAKTKNRIKQKRVDEGTGEEVPYDDVVKGYEISKGKYVIVDEDELSALMPDKTSAIEIVSFVNADGIDPIHYDKPYYVGADKGGDRAYTLLAEAMQETGKVAIGRFVMRTKEYLCMIRPGPDNTLVISTLRWADQIRDPKAFAPEAVDISAKEVAMAATLVESMSDEFDIAEIKDETRERVLELINAKAEGKEIAITEAPTPSKSGEDLFAALEASLSQSKKEQQKAV